MDNNQLVRYTTGEVVPRKADKAVAAAAKKVYDETRLAGLKADGAMALAGHIMDGYVMLDQKRQALTDGDPVLNAMLAEIQVAAVRKVKSIQSNLFDGWEM